MKPRQCTIESASIEDADGKGDGCYDLLDVKGTPKKIAKAIASALREGDLASGNTCAIDDNGQALYLNVRIRFEKGE